MAIEMEKTFQARRVIDASGDADVACHASAPYRKAPRYELLGVSVSFGCSGKVKNLLVSGRCVAGDKISHAATRQMMCCAVTGQGAGIAAAVSLKDNVTCREVNVSKVQSALSKQGVRLI
jgi:hypothetical protein